ncbi:large neutral amino acids transporter small subunit 1-like isoform X2 [Lineus longissimus]|uniref:large neutral amino acids transporter small subunit 1-like isoform X2 n=1 Tax=Lineus longissimus TaxID=88925 RepID=UPI00315D46FE
MNRGVERVELKRQLTLLHGVVIIVGGMIGSGIFVSPVGILRHVQSPGMSLVVWFLLGLISTGGALCYAELGTTFKVSGGEFVYIKKGLGDTPGYIYLLNTLVLNFGAGLTISGLVLATYIFRPVFQSCEPPEMAVKLVAMLAVTLLTAINCYNVKWAAKVQVVFTACKLLALGIIIVLGFVEMGRGRLENLHHPFEGSDYSAGSLALAFYSGTWAFGGWNYLNFLTEELKDPNKNLPRAIVISILVVTGVYLLANVAYMTVLSTDEMLESPAVAVTFAERTLGPAAFIMPLFVAASVFGAMNGGTLAISRVFFIGGEEGQLPQFFSMIHMKRLTPAPSLLIMCMVTLVMLTSGDIFYLLEMMGFGFATIFAMVLASMLYMRYKLPDIPRPIKMPIVLPIALFIWSLILLSLTVYEKPVDSGICLLIMIGSLPVYWICVCWKNKPKFLMRKIDATNRFLQKLLLVVPRDKKSEDME